jgi:acyl carrier protein
MPEESAAFSRNKELISTFIRENFLMYQEGSPLDEEASFLDEGIIDSTGVLEIISFLEQTFHIKIEDEELVPENLDSVMRLARFVERKTPRAAPGTDALGV